MELIDSHCHLDFPELAANTPAILERMRGNCVVGAVCVSVQMEDLPRVLTLAETHDALWATVGVHPDHQNGMEPTPDELVAKAQHPKVLAIGETGLDYYRIAGPASWQQERFRNHVRAARIIRKPLVVHTREAASDTIRILKDEGAKDVGGVMHCFTETKEVAFSALDLGFYISFSGILSFKSAENLRAVARALPRDRILIETDSPYLAPVPFRGKTNEPAYVRHVAEALARCLGLSLEEVAALTTTNFRELWPGTL